MLMEALSGNFRLIILTSREKQRIIPKIVTFSSTITSFPGTYEASYILKISFRALKAVVNAIKS